MTISCRGGNGALYTARVEQGRVVGVFRGVGAAATKLGAAALQRMTASNREAVDHVLSRAFDVAGVA